MWLNLFALPCCPSCSVCCRPTSWLTISFFLTDDESLLHIFSQCYHRVPRYHLALVMQRRHVHSGQDRCTSAKGSSRLAWLLRPSQPTHTPLRLPFHCPRMIHRNSRVLMICAD